MTGNLSETLNKAFESYWGAMSHLRGLQAQNANWEALLEAERQTDWYFYEILETIAQDFYEMQELEELFKRS